MDSHRCYHGVNLNASGMVTWSFFFYLFIFLGGGGAGLCGSKALNMHA